MEKEKIISVAGMGAQDFVALTNYGNLWRYTTVWEEIILPPGLEEEVPKITEEVDSSGRMPKGYALHKDNSNGLFFWTRAAESAGKETEPPTPSQFFERMEGAIASSRTDFMIKHPPAKPVLTK